MSIHRGCNTTLSSANGRLPTNIQNGRKYTTVLCIRIHCSWKSNGLVPSLPFRLWQSHLRLPEVHLYSTLSLARLPSLLPLTLPYPGSHPSKSHAYPQQNAQNLTTASSLIKKKGSCPYEADCNVYSQMCLLPRWTLTFILPQQACLRLHYI